MSFSLKKTLYNRNYKEKRLFLHSHNTPAEIIRTEAFWCQTNKRGGIGTENTNNYTKLMHGVR